jgi:dienelactone hydrolase
MLLSILWLARLEAAGPQRIELSLYDGAPATLYLPQQAAEDRTVEAFGAPPAVVLAHGFASDRAGMSILARSLTQAGYAVLTFDFLGHGANRGSFPRGRGSKASLHADMQAAVDLLRASTEVDGARISVMGHSMGAGAALDYAESDPALDATVMISGGWRFEGPYRPSNALFLYGEGDPARIREASARLAAELAEVSRLDPGTVVGGFAESTAISHVEVARADHITILGSSYAARTIVGWLDDSYGVERGTFFLRSDPRLSAALIGLLAFLLVLPGLGEGVGRLAPRLETRSREGALGRLGLLAVALVATLPLVSVGDPARILPLVVGNVVVVHFFAAGVAILGGLLLTRRFDASALRSGLASSFGSALLGLVVLYLLLTPFGVVFHSLGLTPERGVLALGAALLVFPFQFGFHYLLRRGGTVAAAIASLVGRLLIVGVLVLAVSAGVLSGVVMLMLPVLALLFVLFEVVSSAVYARSRNYLASALIESVWLAWIFAAVLPVAL